MEKVILGIGALAACLSVLGCDAGKQPEPATPAPAAAAAESEAPKPAASTVESRCSPLGCSGDGTFLHMCECVEKPQTPPLNARWTGQYSNSFKRPLLEVTNTTDREISWGSVAVYYYDKTDKQLETEIGGEKLKVSRDNGVHVALKPKQTEMIRMGFERDKEPQGIDAIEVVFDGWCFGEFDDEKNRLCVSNEKAPEQRAKSGR